MLLRLTLAVLCFTALDFAQVKNPKLNYLEVAKGKQISAEVAQAQSESAAASAALTKAQADSKTAVEPKKGTIVHQNLVRVQRRQTQAQAGLARLQAKLDAWNKDVVTSHKGDPQKQKADWTAGTIINK